MESKVCEVCGGNFDKKSTESKKYWSTKKYCSNKCSLTKTSIGKSSFQIHYKKGNVPWSKSKKGIHLSPKSEFKKGNIPWTKGKDLLKGKDNPNWKSIEKECIVCQNKFFVQPYRAEKARFCSYKCYHKWHIGKNSPVWTDNYKKRFRIRIMELPEYVSWRIQVFQRDNYTCQICGLKKSGQIEAHHIIPVKKLIEQYKITNIEIARNCKELWDISNGQTLCKSCHRKTDTYGMRKV